MSEQNILNPAATSDTNPDYGYQVSKLPDLLFQPRSGSPYVRQVEVRGRTIQLPWSKRLLATRHTLEQWEEQYRDGFFSFYEAERARYFTGRFAAPLVYSPAGNDQWNISGTFMEIPGLAMFQYPSNWARDAIFWGIRDDFGNPRPKLTGTWDRRTKNYLLRSEQIDNAAWINASSGGVADPTRTANATADPTGAVTAEQLDFPLTGGAQRSTIVNHPIPPALKGQTFTFSIYLRAAAPLSIRIIIEEGGTPTSVVLDCAVTAVWQRFSVTLTVPVASASTQLNCYLQNNISQPAKTVFAWGGQLEYGSAPSTYVQTVAAAVELPAPLANTPFLKRDLAYWNDGTDVNALAELEYIGYGFRLYAPTNVDMGIMNLSVTRDGTTEVAATPIDLYSAAAVNSAVVSTQTNLPLGKHRVILQGTNTKNGASSAKNILLDAIEIMK